MLPLYPCPVCGYPLPPDGRCGNERCTAVRQGRRSSTIPASSSKRPVLKRHATAIAERSRPTPPEPDDPSGEATK